MILAGGAEQLLNEVEIFNGFPVCATRAATVIFIIYWETATYPNCSESSESIYLILCAASASVESLTVLSLLPEVKVLFLRLTTLVLLMSPCQSR